MGQAGQGHVFVDLSNVAKHELLGFSQHHADLGRWDRLKAVWVRSRGRPQRFTLIADESLPRALSRSDQMRLETLLGQGGAAVVPDADVEILRRAIPVRGTVLSNDRFVDHLRTPNLDAVTLVGWVVRGSTVLLTERPLDRLQSAVISARAQKQHLKQMGLDEDAPEMGFRWYCRDSSCKADLVAIPEMRQGSPVCPSCGAYLERGSAWVTPVWVKVMHRSDEVMRFVLEDGERVYIGRGTDDDTVSLAQDFDHASDVLALDRKHVGVLNSAGQLHVTDPGTATGTAVRYPVAGQRKVLSPPMRLPAGKHTPVPIGAKVVLGTTPYTVQIAGSMPLANP
jgi:hypothetical protein